MINKQGITHKPLLVVYLPNFPLNIFSCQHRNALECLWIFFCLLICLQIGCFLYQKHNFFLRQTIFVILQFFFCLPVSFCCQSTFWIQSDVCCMCILNQPCLHKLLKITRLHFFFQFIKDIKEHDLLKWHIVVIQPGSEHIQPVHQSLRIGRIVRLAETKFHKIDAGFQRFRLDSITHNLFQCLIDYLTELLFVLFVRIFRHQCKRRLIDSVIVRTIHILTDSRIQKCLL